MSLSTAHHESTLRIESPTVLELTIPSSDYETKGTPVALSPALLLDRARDAAEKGRAKEARGYYEQIISICQDTLARQPTNWKLHELKACAEYRTGTFKKAWHSYQRARTDPEIFWPSLLGQIKAGIEIGLWKDLEKLNTADMPLWVDKEWLSASTLLTLPIAKHGDDLRKAAVIEARRRAGNCTAEHHPLHQTAGKLRIGYLSPDFNNHAVAHQIVRVLECHDRTQFELYGYSTGHNDNSRIGQRIRSCFSTLRIAQGRTAAEIARWIASDKIDILVDLAGHTTGNRMDVLAHHSAPVQVSWLGYPCTTGADYIDYFIVDAIVAPPEHRTHFTEALVTMPDCYLPADNRQPVDEVKPARQSCGLPDAAVILAAFHPAYKLDPNLFRTWMNILHRCPNTCLWLRAQHPELRANLEDAIRAHGVNPRQVVLDDVILEKPAYLARLQLADIFLDTHHFNGHSTVSDALWAGVPVISTPGDTFAARVGASLLNAAGIPECIAPTLCDYERLVIELATDRERLRELSNTLRSQKMSVPLFATEQWTRHLESAYLEMAAIHKSSMRPRDFAIHA
ncbi:MAG: hypothetical protein SFY80_03235 [Verrucomicrobiota bacterium]|nr:hypothetical protein [Verrucomicrobiota bacterium]